MLTTSHTVMMTSSPLLLHLPFPLGSSFLCGMQLPHLARTGAHRCATLPHPAAHTRSILRECCSVLQRAIATIHEKAEVCRGRQGLCPCVCRSQVVF